MTIVLIIKAGTTQVLEAIADDRITQDHLKAAEAGGIYVVPLDPSVLLMIDAEQRRVGFIKDAEEIEELFHKREEPQPQTPLGLKTWKP